MIATIILLVLITLSFGVHIALDGERKRGDYSAGWGFVAYAITIALYYWAGLFDKFM